LTYARGGQSALVTRRLAQSQDPVALHEALAGEGAPFFLRRSGGQSMILVDAALRLEARGLEATLVAQSEGGVLLLDGIAERLAAHVSGRDERELRFTFPRCMADDEQARASAPTPLDIIMSTWTPHCRPALPVTSRTSCSCLPKRRS
jgi:hypothetical protein